MPELPEVESTRRTLWPHVKDKLIHDVHITQPSLRRLVDSVALQERVCHARIVGLRRRAKYLLFDLAAASAQSDRTHTVMAVHLGMTGGLTVVPSQVARQIHDHVQFTLDDGRLMRFNDARRFGSIDVFEATQESRQTLFKHLGAEPFDSEAFAAERLFQASRKVSRTLKQFLLDGRFVVGVGNIYASEALWRAKISPRLPAGRLSRAQASGLVDAVVLTLQDAIAFGGTTLRDFGDADGKAGGYGTRLVVYGRDGQKCYRCDKLIRKIVQNQRSTFYCGQCQRR